MQMLMKLILQEEVVFMVCASAANHDQIQVMYIVKLYYILLILYILCRSRR